MEKIKILRHIERIYRKEQFNPGILGIFINPFYLSRRGIYSEMKENSKYLNGKILDIGCGTKPYKKLFKFEEYIGIDIENPGHDHSKEDVDLFYDGKKIPFKDKLFDSIICTQVLEHVKDSNNFLKELKRVLKIGGRAIISVPLLEGEHEIPMDFRRYTSFGLKKELEKIGFKILIQRKTNKGISAISQILNSYIYLKFKDRNKIIRIISILVTTPFFNFIGLLLKLISKNENLYLNNFVVIEKTNR